MARSRMSTATAAALILATIGVTVVLATRSRPAAQPVRHPRPNIVLILTDDQRYDELGWMPTVESRLVGKGVTFRNGFVVNPLCCPSRATILTGQYSHGTGVYSNHPPLGGFEAFLDDEGSTVATWLQQGGYQTAMVGKYMNGYRKATASHVAPGWDQWDALAPPKRRHNPGREYYGYWISENGRLARYGFKPRDYSTDVLATYAAGFIDSSDPSRPLFLYFAPRAPHSPATPAPRDRRACRGLPPYRPPGFNEADVSDKPSWVQTIPELSPRKISSIDQQRVNHCRALQDVDRSVGRILDALRTTGRLSNTLIVYASDNGVEFGEHRLTAKEDPYEASIRVPIVVRYDPLTRGRATVNNDLVLNLDFAPTFAAAARVKAPAVDGRSLLPLLGGSGSRWRTVFLVEHWGEQRPKQPPVPPAYCAVRTTRYIYIEYSTGEHELYDLKADPHELFNRASVGADAPIDSVLHEALVKLCSPPPPGMTP
jgi:N-acetylglucosamine-6-sulfatase